MREHAEGASLESRAVPEYRRPANLGDRWRPTLPHGEGKFGVENIEYLFHAFLPEGRQAVDVRPADAYAASADGQGFIYVGTAAEAAIHKNGELRTHGVHDFGKYI